MRRDAVNLVVRRHDTQDVAFGHGSFKTREEDLAQNALRIICGGDVRATFGLAVGGKVFGGGYDVVPIYAGTRSLQRSDNCYRHARDKVWILAVGFFGSAPARLARHVEVRPKHLMASTCSGFQRRVRENPGVEPSRPPRGTDGRRQPST